MQKNNRKKRNNKGFSMVELIIVIAIMAALVGILAPQYIKYVDKSRKAADEATADRLYTAVQTVAADPDIKIANGTYKVTWAVAAGNLTFDPTAAADTSAKALSDALTEALGTLSMPGMKASSHTAPYEVTLVVAANSVKVTETAGW